MNSAATRDKTISKTKSKPKSKTKTRSEPKTKPRTKTKAKASSPLRVLMVAAEAAPFAKVGGLGDVTGTLPRRLVELGLEVTVVLPFYREVRLNGYEPQPTGTQVALSHAGIHRKSPVLELAVDGVRYWFIKEEGLFDRDGVYGPPGGEYPDSAERFSYLSRAAVEASRVMVFDADIVHCHDWHTALTPLYLDLAGMDRIKKFLTIHNLAYQGVFGQEILGSLELFPGIARDRLLDNGGNANFLKAGIVSADLVTTVSPTYAEEIQAPDLGWGLDGFLRQRKESLVGILNGIDYDEWDPGKDPNLAAPFTAENSAGRRLNRKSLLDEMGLDAHPESAVLAFVGRLVHQKGADLLVSALPGIMEEDFRVIVLGTGDPTLENSLREASVTYDGRVSVHIGFNESLARRIYAGTDYFLMPSRFEPCGLGQMIAMRYGAVPVVHATGGLRDTVRDLEAGRDGNGIVFSDILEEELVAAVRRAGKIFKNGRLEEIVPRIMSMDNSWRRSAKVYSRLYRELANGERNGEPWKVT